MEPLFTFLHLSDIHFGHGDASHRADQRLVLERLGADIRAHAQRGVPRPDAILVTGDIAFSGNAKPREPGFDEYGQATTWLHDIARDLGLERSAIFTVPGNHDIQRTAESDRDGARLLKSLREGGSIDDSLVDPGDCARLAARLKNYLAFASRFAPACQDDAFAKRLYWTWTIDTRRGLRVRLVGLNTALLANDDKDHGRLQLGKRQLADAFAVAREPREVVLVLGHHPFAGGWLSDEREAARWTQASANVHLCGHIHEHRSEERRAAGQGRFVELAAGAVHGERVAIGVPETHRYHIAGIVVGSGGQLLLRVWPRCFSDQRKDFVTDSAAVEDGAPYAEHQLGLQWINPIPADPPAHRASTPAIHSTSHDVALAERLQKLVNTAHETEIADALSALLSGENVAFQVPAGFGASRAVRRAADDLRDSTRDVIVHYISSRVPFSDVNAFLDDIREELSRKAPLPEHQTEEKRDLRLFRALRETARTLHKEGRRLVVCVDDVERFREEHQPWVAELLGVFGHLDDHAVSDDALRSVRVLVAGGEWLQQHLIGRVKATPLSPFNKARRIFLGPVKLQVEEERSELRRIVNEVGGHPELLLWAARHGGQTHGNPASEENLFHDQVRRFRSAPYRGQIEQMLRGDAAAWRDPDLAIRWSGWVKPDLSHQGWLGPVLERLAQLVVAG